MLQMSYLHSPNQCTFSGYSTRWNHFWWTWGQEGQSCEQFESNKHLLTNRVCMGVGCFSQELLKTIILAWDLNINVSEQWDNRQRSYVTAETLQDVCTTVFLLWAGDKADSENRIPLFISQLTVYFRVFCPTPGRSTELRIKSEMS